MKLASGKTKKLTAFVYIMHEERSLGIPPLAYIRTCEEGYRNFGFDTKFLDATYEISKRRCSDERPQQRASHLPEMRAGVHCPTSPFPCG